MVSRRRLLAGLAAIAASTFSPGVVAQISRRPARIGVLSAGSIEDVQARMSRVSADLRQLGWTEGKDYRFEIRAGGTDPKRMVALAEELVRAKVDILITASTPASLAAQAATRTIPVVFTMVSDPVESGLVTNLAHPGANLTGWSNVLPETSGKLLGLLAEVVPGLKRVAVLYDADNAGKRIDLKEIRRAARGIAVLPFELRTRADISAAFAALVREHAQAAIVLQDGVTFPNRDEVVRLAAQHRIPAAYQLRNYVEEGGLLSYGLNLLWQNQRTAAYVDRILRGARPGDLPVELPTHFELFVNVKAAQAIGLKIPQSMIVRADQVVE